MRLAARNCFNTILPWSLPSLETKDFRCSPRQHYPLLSARISSKSHVALPLSAALSQNTGPASLDIQAHPYGLGHKPPGRATALGWALPPLVAVALGAADCKARNGDLLASKRVPLLLAMEESAGRTGKAGDRWGGSGVDWQDEFGQSALGSAADPWGTAQARYRSLPGHRGQVHVFSAKTAFPN